VTRSILQLFIAVAAVAPAFAQAPASGGQGPPEWTKSIASRVELHPIQTLTLPDSAFLRGDAAAGKAVTVVGELRVAQGTGRLPVVVLIHGSGGVGPNVETWVQQFNAMGISTFVIDGFTGRGLTSVSTDQALLGRLNLILDAYRALDVLVKHPRVDPARIALMGFSRGGQAALYASLTRFHRMWNKSGSEFAAYIPFYPDCATTYQSDADVAGKPIRIFHGVPDDYNPLAPCNAFVERLKAAGRDVELTTYPNAQHTFDNPLSPPLAVAAGSQTVRRCAIREEPIGQLVNAATKEPFTYKDVCVEKDPHVGFDADASRAAHEAVGDFVRKLFK
jgi:dienelactone hydrolase